MAIKAKRYDADSYQLLDGAAVVGLAIRLANDRWVMKSRDDARIGRKTYDKPADVAKDFAAAQDQ